MLGYLVTHGIFDRELEDANSQGVPGALHFVADQTAAQNLWVRQMPKGGRLEIAGHRGKLEYSAIAAVGSLYFLASCLKMSLLWDQGLVNLSR